MSNHEIRPTTLTGIKRLATTLKRSENISHGAALDVASRRAGFENFRHAKDRMEHGVKPEATLGFAVFLTAYWKQEDGTSGRETLVTHISRPLRDLARRGRGAGAYDLRYFRVDADDHLENYEDFVSQGTARLLVMEAARALHFLDAANLAGKGRWSYRIPQVPHQDHSHEWIHTPTGAEVLADEPYHSEWLHKERCDWGKDKGLHFAMTPVRLYDHGRGSGREPMFFTSFSKDALDAVCAGLQQRAEQLAWSRSWSGESAPYAPIFRSPVQQASARRKRPRPRAVEFDKPTNGALPYLFSPLSSELSWRPAAAMPLEAHEEVGRLINCLLLVDGRYFSTLSHVRQLLDSWLGCELGQADMLGTSMTDIYWRKDKVALPAGTTWQTAFDRISELLTANYPNSRPLRNLQKKLLSAKAQIERKEAKLTSGGPRREVEST